MKNTTSNSINTSIGDTFHDSGELVRGPENDIGTAIGALGVVLNALSLVVFIKNKRLLAEIPRKIILHQCLVDLLSGTFLIYSQYNSFYLGIDMPSGLPDPAAYCYILWSTYILWSFFTISSWNIQALAIERYMSVCHPIAHKNRCTSRFIFALFFTLWIGGFAWLGLFTYNMKYFPNTNQCMYAPDKNSMVDTVYGTGFLIHSYVLPIFIMLFAYCRMLFVLKKRISSNSGGPVSSNVKDARKTRSFIIVCATIGVAYFVCYSFNVFYYFLSSIKVIDGVETEATFSLFTILMVFANCFINPLIFLTRMPGYRVAVIKMLCGKNTIQSIIVSGSSNSVKPNRSTNNMTQ